MKKTVLFMSLVLAAFVFASCTVVVKERPRWAVVNTYGNVDVIKVWRVDGLAGESVAELQPGTKVKILKIKPHAVLIELPGGNTGWISRKHFGKDLEVY
jgi:hypothetical protein